MPIGYTDDSLAVLPMPPVDLCSNSFKPGQSYSDVYTDAISSAPSIFLMPRVYEPARVSLIFFVGPCRVEMADYRGVNSPF